MLHSTPKLLVDILEEVDFILDRVRTESYPSFVENGELYRAMKWSFFTIGEATVRLRQSDPETLEKVPGYREIIGFRNVLAHGYDQIDSDRVWTYIRSDLPELRDAVARLLSDFE